MCLSFCRFWRFESSQKTHTHTHNKISATTMILSHFPLFYFNALKEAKKKISKRKKKQWKFANEIVNTIFKFVLWINFRFFFLTSDVFLFFIKNKIKFSIWNCNCKLDVSVCVGVTVYFLNERIAMIVIGHHCTKDQP